VSEREREREEKEILHYHYHWAFLYSSLPVTMNLINNGSISVVACPSDGPPKSHVSRNQLLLIRPCTGKPAGTFSDRPLFPIFNAPKAIYRKKKGPR
jgi:hypothetical protein